MLVLSRGKDRRMVCKLRSNIAGTIHRYRNFSMLERTDCIQFEWFYFARNAHTLPAALDRRDLNYGVSQALLTGRNIWT